MVKLYLNTDSKTVESDSNGKYMDISLVSFIKVHIIALALISGVLFGIGFIFGMLGYLVGLV